MQKVRRVINRDIPLLILGETGTGKELLARAVHQESNRAKQPFVAVNCASIPESLIEAELFGYEEGAFTGAKRKGAVGRIVQANGGTLFLDEIGDMPLALQARLLRVLQERVVTPLGSHKHIGVDIAVIGAGWLNGALAVTIVSVPAFARLTRASVLQEKQKEYVTAARTVGATTPRLMFRTILPNCLGPLLVQAAFVATWAILLEAALSFLGLGVKPPMPSWGQMLSAGKTFLYRAWWYGFFPGLALSLVVLSLNTLGETTQRIVTRGWRNV